MTRRIDGAPTMPIMAPVATREVRYTYEDGRPYQVVVDGPRVGVAILNTYDLGEGQAKAVALVNVAITAAWNAGLGLFENGTVHTTPAAPGIATVWLTPEWVSIAAQPEEAGQ